MNDFADNKIHQTYMTVEQLIKTLQNYPMDKTVFVFAADKDGNWFELEVESVAEYNETSYPSPHNGSPILYIKDE